MDGSPLEKMRTAVDAEGRVAYRLMLHGQALALNELVGRAFTLRFTGARTCMACGKRVKKFYGQGLCWPCLSTAPEASPCIIRPELCEAHLGRGRDPAWELAHHLQEHVVYLAFTGAVKVGVTRSTQVPVRWVDQGADRALPVARVPHRQLAGRIECDLKRLFTDRTQWKAMLSAPATADAHDQLLRARALVLEQTAPELKPYLLPGEEPVQLHYPLRDLPPKLTNVHLDKLDEVQGCLLGIKGQYLVWADGRVLNVRNHTGYHVEVMA
jgi:hypothetical protein